VGFGIESGSPLILKAMRKGITVEQNERAIMWTKEAGLLVAISVIIGYPGETVKTLNQTFDFINRVKPDMVYVCTAAPYPGTALYELVKNLGWKMSKDWNRYENVDFAFENPSLSSKYLKKVRKDFFNKFYSPRYIIHHFCKHNPYSGVLVRTALNHNYWRLRSLF
jgi:anaerobic magnesium-protoporphyrin IX monomethyl ester cyclase